MEISTRMDSRSISWRRGDSRSNALHHKRSCTGRLIVGTPPGVVGHERVIHNPEENARQTDRGKCIPRWKQRVNLATIKLQ